MTMYFIPVHTLLTIYCWLHVVISATSDLYVAIVLYYYVTCKIMIMKVLNHQSGSCGADRIIVSLLIVPHAGLQLGRKQTIYACIAHAMGKLQICMHLQVA